MCIDKLRSQDLSLEDDADQQIYAKYHVDAFSFYQSLSELLKHLKEIYCYEVCWHWIESSQ